MKLLIRIPVCRSVGVARKTISGFQSVLTNDKDLFRFILSNKSSPSETWSAINELCILDGK